MWVFKKHHYVHHYQYYHYYHHVIILQPDVILLENSAIWKYVEHNNHPQLKVYGGTTWCLKVLFTLWLFNIDIENCPFIDDFPIKTSIY